MKNSTPLSLLPQALESITQKPCLTAACHHVHEVIMKQLGEKNPCNYQQCVIKQFSWAQEAPIGLSMRVRLISSSSLDRPWAHHCDHAIKNPLLPCRWHQSIPTKPEPAKQARLENTGTLW